MIQRTGNKRLAVVGWGRGMGHKGHMYLASSVITQAQKMNADAYFFVSKTVGKDDPIFPEEKVKIYQTVFPQQAPIFQPQGNLNQALTDLAQDGYQGVVLVVGADQKDAFKYLERPNKEGVPVFQSMGLKKLRVISRQETGDSSAELEGPRATPMREVLMHPDATEEQKFKVWRDAMPDALGDNEVMDLMKKAEARLMGSRPKKTKVAESRIMDRDARINAYYVSKKGDKHRVAENIPYYLLDKLVPLLTKKYAITMNDIVVKPVDQSQYRRTSHPELAEGVQCNPNEVAELLYKVKPEIFSRFGDDFVMDAITQACEQHTGSAQEVAVKVVEILKQGIAEGRKANTKAARKEFGARPRKENPAEQDAKKKESDEAWQRLMQYAADQKKEQGVAEGKYKCTCHPGDADPDCPVHGLEPMEVGDALDVKEGEEDALAYATKAHAGQTRSGGDPYITHPMRVADHIRQYKQSHNLDALISAAYLHDTIEDTDTTQEILHDLFGGLVASLVKELTSDPEQIKKMGKAAYLSHKMAAMSSYGLVIKLADRLDNVKDITTARTPQWRAKYAQETNQILDYIEKTRALTGTHNKLISLIRAKLAEIDNPQQGVAEGSTGVSVRGWANQVRKDHGTDIKFVNRKEGGGAVDMVRAINSQGETVGVYNRKTGYPTVYEPTQGLGEASFDKEEFRRHMEQLRAREELRKTDPVSAKALDLRGQLPQATKKKPEDDSMSINDPRHPSYAYTQAGQHKVDEEGITRRGILKGIAGAAALGAAGKASAIAGAFPTPSHQQAMYKAAADSNRAEAKRQAELKAKADAERLEKNTQEVDREQRVNHHKLDEFAPGNGDDGDNYAEYVVYQCDPNDQFEFIGGPLYQSDNLGMAHKYAYEHFLRYRPKAFVIYQPHAEASRGNYGVKDERGVIEDLSENNDYLDEK